MATQQGSSAGVPDKFTEIKDALIKALVNVDYFHEPRAGTIDEKNLLQAGTVTPQQVAELVKRGRGTHMATSPHRTVKSVDVHVLKIDGWYIKFYFLPPEPDTWFISVHK